MKKQFIIQPAPHPSRQRAEAAVRVADDGDVVTIGKATKRRIQEEKYHAMIGDISDHVKGDLADPEDAKRILISAFRIDTRVILAKEWAEFGDVRMGRGLRGEVVLLGIQSRYFPVALASAFIDWLYSFGADVGVAWSERGIELMETAYA